MTRIIIRFGLLAVAMVLLMQLSKYTWLRYQLNTELMILIMAVAFIGIGVYASRNWKKNEQAIPDQDFSINQKELKRTGISERELEVLQMMAEGNSNREIADALFVSENTIKTHISNLFLKIEAKRRTEAIKKAKEKGLIP